MNDQRKVVATFTLPHGEGEADLMVERVDTSSWLSKPIGGSYFLFHKPHCGGPMRPTKITDLKMVLHCAGCNLRLVLLVKKQPTTLGELAEALDQTCKHSDLPERA